MQTRGTAEQLLKLAAVAALLRRCIFDLVGIDVQLRSQYVEIEKGEMR